MAHQNRRQNHYEQSGSGKYPPSDNELWNVIYSKEQLSKMDSTLKKAEAKVQKDKKSLERVQYFRKNVFVPLLKAQEDYKKRTESISGFQAGLSPETPAVAYLQPWKPVGKPFPKTKVTVWDLADKLEFTFDCDEPDMANETVVSRKHDDPGVWQDNGVELFLNPSGDRINYYHLMVNSLGNLTDSVNRKVGSKSESDLKWNSGAVVKTSKKAKSWQAVITVEKAKFGKWNPEGFAVNFNRNRVTKNAVGLFTWSPFLQNGFHHLERFGSIVPAKNIKANIVSNSNFEEKNWGSWGGWQPKQMKPGEKKELDRRNFVFADKSLKMTYQGDNSNSRMALAQTLHQLKPGKKYRLTFFMKLDNVVPLRKGGGAGIQIWNSSKNFWFPSKFISGTMPWTMLQL